MIRVSYLILVILLLVVPASAALNDIPSRGTVFLGEEGLDITATNVTDGLDLAWWAPGNALDSTPSYTTRVDNAEAFYINPQIFGTRTGTWYIYPTRELVFYVQEPSLDIRPIYVEMGIPVVEKIFLGEEIRFRIDNNLYVMGERPGVEGAPVTIHVRDARGVEYAALINARGETTSLLNIPVTTSAYETVPIWDTGYPAYGEGLYEIWADCNANNMKDNYPAEGKTITAVEEWLVGGVGVTITTTTTSTPPPTTEPTPPPTPEPTTPPTTFPPTSPPATVTSLPPTTTTPPPTTTIPGFEGMLGLLSLAGIAILLGYRNR
jgi:hypothetical protein